MAATKSTTKKRSAHKAKKRATPEQLEPKATTLVESVGPDSDAWLKDEGQNAALRALPPGWPFESMGFTPTTEAVLLARLHDGEARVPWEPPRFDNEENRAEGAWVDDADFARAKELLALVVEAFETGERVLLGRLAGAIDLLRDRPQTQSDRLSQYVKAVDEIVEGLRRFRAQRCDDRRMRWYAEQYIKWLAQSHDPAFSKLRPMNLLQTTLKGVANDAKGGSGRLRATHIAAELAVHVNAFNAKKTDNFSSDVIAFKSRLKKEVTLAKAR